jgi:hypothetical protein
MVGEFLDATLKGVLIVDKSHLERVRRNAMCSQPTGEVWARRSSGGLSMTTVA